MQGGDLQLLPRLQLWLFPPLPPTPLHASLLLLITL